jgi:hypothetical protein
VSKDRDLDAAIAEKIYGWKPCPVPVDAHGKNACEVLTHDGTKPDGYEWPNVGVLHRGYFAPLFTSDLYDALTLANKVGLTFEAGKIPTDAALIAIAAFAKWEGSRRNP